MGRPTNIAMMIPQAACVTSDNHLDRIAREEMIAKGLPSRHGKDLYIGHLRVKPEFHRYFDESHDQIEFEDHNGTLRVARKCDEGSYFVMEQRY